MSKQEWRAHMAEVGFESTNVKVMGADRSKEALAHMKDCSTCKARKRTFKANRARREREDTMRCLGMVKTAYGWE
jgi:hypothetical protein